MEKSSIDLLALDNLSKLVQNVTQDLKLNIEPEPPVKKWRYLTPDESTLMTQRAMGCKPEDEIKMNPGWADRVIPMETLVRESKRDEKKEEDSDDHPLLEDREEDTVTSLVYENIADPESDSVSEEDSLDETTGSLMEKEMPLDWKKRAAYCCYALTFIHAIIGLTGLGILVIDELSTHYPSEIDELAFTWNPDIGMSSGRYSPYEVKDSNQVVCQSIKSLTFNPYRFYYSAEITAAVVLKKPVQNGTAVCTASSHLFVGHDDSHTMDFRLGTPTKILAMKFTVIRSIFDLPITYLKVSVAPSDDMPYTIEVPCSDVEVRNEFMMDFAAYRQKLGHSILSRLY